MSAISTSLLRPNVSQFQSTPSPSHASASLKLLVPLFTGDNYDGRKRRCKVRLQMAKDSDRIGHTKEVENKAELFDQGLRPLINGPENSGNQEAVSSKEGEGDVNVLECVDEDGGTKTGISNQLEERQSDGQDMVSADTALKGTVLAGLLLVGLVGGFGAVSYIYREPINAFLVEFSEFLEGYGTAGYALFVAVYAGLEILAIPAIPLTMSAGLLFGTVTGTIIVSIAGTIAATAAFLIARYLVRDRVLKLAKGNKKFLAIDKAIGEDGFRVVALLRLSPLLPFSLGNYLYGLTSVKLVPYVLGSWLGMLPGTWAYVSAGAVGRAIIQEEANNDFSGGPEQLLTIGIGILVTVFAATYVTRLAKEAVKDIE